MPWVAAVGAVAGGLISSAGARGAAGTQAQAAEIAAQNQMQMFQQQQANMQPWLRAGGQAVGQMGALMAPGGAMATAPTAQDIMQYMAPNYQFQLQQGLGQAGAQANAAGGMVSGNALQGLNQFAQNYAQGAYQNAFQNYQTAQTNIFNRLASIAGLGQTSAGQTMAGGMGAAGTAGGFSTAGAAAQAAGQVGAANAFTQSLGQLGGMAYSNYLRNQQPNTMQMSTTLGGNG